MSQIPQSHEIYKHFKGNLYQVLELAEHSETGEQLVIYQAMYGDFKIYARPLANFLERLDGEKYPEATQTFRFELQGKEENTCMEEKANIEKPDAGEIAAEEIDTEEIAAEEINAEETKTEDADAENPAYQLDEQVLEFLDADTYEERLNILMGLRHRITDEMITTMAIASDVEVPEGSLEERFLSLKSCLLTKEKYECERPR
ncbi:MAG: DUF1653 domain-containing protein [Lachnospiraceae bacterium]|nr:DUF1653 domain-containing protein [Lachnospiraceae bacterium]